MKSAIHLSIIIMTKLTTVGVLVLVLLATFFPVVTLADDPGDALQFDGSNDYVRLSETSSMLGSGWQDTKTVSLWVKPTGGATCTAPTPAHCDAIIGDRPRWWGISRGVVNGQDRLWLWNYDGSYDMIGVEYTVGEWVHVAMVHANGALTAYKNGVVVGSTASGTTQQPSTGAQPVLQLGGVINNSSRNWTFAGQLDEVRLWTIGRSEAEINADMVRLLSGSEAGLAAYYQMSDGSGSVLTDDSGHGWTGTLEDGGGIVPADGPIQWVPSEAFGGGGGPGNNPPVADSQTVTMAEDTAVGVTLTGSDVDGDNLSYEVVGGPSSGVLSGSAPTLTYTPNGNFNGNDSFTFMVNDGQVDSALAEVTITVNPVNDVPVANGDAAVTNVDTPVTIAVLGNDTDVDGDLLTVSGVGAAGNGTVIANPDGTVTYTPAGGFTGSDSFNYTISDGQGGTATGQVTVTVNPVNDPPVAVADAATTGEDTALVINLLANDSDPDGNLLTVSNVTVPANGTALNNNDGTVTYTPAPNFNGVDTFAYTVSDGNGGQATANVTVTVNPVNDAPAAADDTATTSEGSAVIIALLSNDSDVDGDALTISGLSQGSNGTVADNLDGTVIYTPASGFTGVDTFSYTVSDGNGGEAGGQVTVTVNPAGSGAGYALQFDGSNDYVRLSETSSIFASGWRNTKTVSVWVKPAGGATCTAGSPAHCDAIIGDRPRWWGISRGTIGGNDRIWLWNYDGSYDMIGVEYTVGEWVHVAMVHANGALTAYKNGVAVGNVPSGTTQQPSTGGQPVLQLGGVINNSSRNWTFEGQLDEVQLWNIARSGAEISQDMARTLSGSEAGLAAYYHMSDGSGSVLTDDSGHGWTGTLEDGGGIVPADGPIEWVASGAFGGAGEPGNNPPVADSQTVTTAEDTAAAITLSGSDPDNNPLSYRVVSPPGQGSLSGSGAALTYTPNGNFNGNDSFSFVVNDGQVDSPAGVVAITVTGVNDLPAANGDTAVTNVDTPVTVDVLSNDTDVDGDMLVVSSVGAGSQGTAEINLDGTVTYTPAGGFVGSDSFTYFISDGNGGGAMAGVSVTVNPVNDPPGAVDDAATTDEDTAVVIDLLVNDSDPDGHPLTVSSVTTPANGTALNNNDGTVTYTPAADFYGNDNFSYTVADGNGGEGSAQVTVTVNPVNDPPAVIDDTAITTAGSAVTIAVLSNDSDVDGDPLTISGVSQGSNGAVADNFDGTVTYTPAGGFTGPDSFSYTVSDGNGSEASGQVTVTVNPAGSGAGDALQFDGVNDYVQLGDTGNIMGGTGWAGAKTMSVWLKPTGTGPATLPTGGQTIVSNDYPHTFGITRANYNGADRIWVWNADGGSIDMIGIDFTPGEWLQVALVHNGGYLYAYKNGVLVGSTPSAPTLIPNGTGDGNLYLGGSGRSGTTTYFSGELDEVRLWNAALDQATISAWLNSAVTGAHPAWTNLAAYYQMSDGAGTSLTDDSPNSNTGTLLGGMTDLNWIPSGAFGP